MSEKPLAQRARRSEATRLVLSGFASADEADADDQERVEQLRTIFDAWAAESHPQ